MRTPATNSALVYESKCGDRGWGGGLRAGSQPMSTSRDMELKQTLEIHCKLVTEDFICREFEAAFSRSLLGQHPAEAA